MHTALLVAVSELAAAVIYNHHGILVGGRARGVIFDDVWMFNPSTLLWSEV